MSHSFFASYPQVVKKPEASKPKSKPARKQRDESESEDDEDIDIAKLGGVKGYVTKADGKKTTYFNRELSEEAKELIGDIAPKAIVTPEKTATDSTPPKSGGSVWNQAGTFEERDTTAWCKDALKRLLLQASVGEEDAAAKAAGAEVSVTAVKDLEGDASMCVIRGSKRYIFDFSFTLEWEAVFSQLGKKVKGKLQYTDVDNDLGYDVEIKWKKAAVAEQKSKLNPLLGKEGAGLRAAIRAKIDAFVAEFRASC